ncbi:homing endonuclease associated repeat-containing protein [Enterococcus sp.]|uniref:homing endonuclease associated repeat-containing protein n=1 Tax=Enterococcus sp. TaxID=35783 RepID=UPI002908EEDC|nr:AP2 domain-containing protein [Enterococcus sp.]MDU5336178.1 AP2 domain-containing protein [Enterococcus sp.]
MAKTTITKEFLINKLHAFVEEHGRTPSCTEFGHYYYVRKYFGSYITFVVDQGFPAVPHGNVGLSAKELEEKLKAFVETNKRIPFGKEFGHYVQIRKLYGTFGKFLESCGYEPINHNHRGPSLIGKRFSRLVVISEGKKVRRATSWNCQCDCGNLKNNVPRARLITNRTSSCGCLKKENGHLADYHVDDTYLKVLNHTLKNTNKSGVRGVYYNKKKHKYIAQIGFKRETVYLGSFDTLSEAAAARKVAEEKYFDPILEKYKDRLSKD